MFDGKKVVYRIFTIADYDDGLFKKDAWPRLEVEKSKLFPFIIAVCYTFEKLPPQEMAYQLDFRPIKKAERTPIINYSKIVVGAYYNSNQFSYFRKLTTQLDGK